MKLSLVESSLFRSEFVATSKEARVVVNSGLKIMIPGLIGGLEL